MGRVECTDAGVTLAEQGPQVEDQLLRHRPRLKKPPSGGSNFGAASASPPSRFERLTSLKPPALPGDIYDVGPRFANTFIRTVFDVLVRKALKRVTVHINVWRAEARR